MGFPHWTNDAQRAVMTEKLPAYGQSKVGAQLGVKNLAREALFNTIFEEFRAADEDFLSKMKLPSIGFTGTPKERRAALFDVSTLHI